MCSFPSVGVMKERPKPAWARGEGVFHVTVLLGKRGRDSRLVPEAKAKKEHNRLPVGN